MSPTARSHARRTVSFGVSSVTFGSRGTSLGAAARRRCSRASPAAATSRLGDRQPAQAGVPGALRRQIRATKTSLPFAYCGGASALSTPMISSRRNGRSRSEVLSSRARPEEPGVDDAAADERVRPDVEDVGEVRFDRDLDRQPDRAAGVAGDVEVLVDAARHGPVDADRPGRGGRRGRRRRGTRSFVYSKRAEKNWIGAELRRTGRRPLIRISHAEMNRVSRVKKPSSGPPRIRPSGWQTRNRSSRLIVIDDGPTWTGNVTSVRLLRSRGRVGRARTTSRGGRPASVPAVADRAARASARAGPRAAGSSGPRRAPRRPARSSGPRRTRPC